MAEPTQERLLEVSAELFAEHGVTGVSMRRIARAAGITQAAIYHHFANKEELYFASVAHLTEEKTSHVAESLASETCPINRFSALVRAILKLFDADPHFRRIYMREILEGDQRRLAKMANSVFANLQQLADDVLRDIDSKLDSQLTLLSLAGTILHQLEARELNQMLSGGKPEHRELPVLADHIVSLFLHGVVRP